jgi:hypothetical protein
MTPPEPQLCCASPAVSPYFATWLRKSHERASNASPEQILPADGNARRDSNARTPHHVLVSTIARSSHRTVFPHDPGGSISVYASTSLGSAAGKVPPNFSPPPLLFSTRHGDTASVGSCSASFSQQWHIVGLRFERTVAYVTAHRGDTQLNRALSQSGRLVRSAPTGAVYFPSRKPPVPCPLHSWPGGGAVKDCVAPTQKPTTTD